MTSSQSALLVAGVSVLLSALVLTTAQRRVIARPEPRTASYVVAWLVTVAVLGGLRSASDYMVGNTSTSRMLFSFAWMAAVCALALFLGHRVRQPAQLFILHTVVMALFSYI